MNPTTSWPCWAIRYSSRFDTLPGTCTSPTHGVCSAISSRLLECAVIVTGRVCGTAIGMVPRPMVWRTPSRSASSRTAVMNRSHFRSGSMPASSRNGVPTLSCSAYRLSSGSS